ncbi:uncharacterized protein TNCV_2888161 [Trichonephila clavipes]|nr:uncharacterized protein TNCV_2888161 [Trichonephila clavipes]
MWNKNSFTSMNQHGDQKKDKTQISKINFKGLEINDPPCDISKYERCVLVSKMPEPSCSPQNMTSTSQPEVKRPYVCRCYPCLYRNGHQVCVPSCPQPEEEA